MSKVPGGSIKTLDVVSEYVRVHGHGGEFGVDVFAGCCGCAAGEGLGRRHLVLPAELQGSAAIQLFDLRQVRLGCDHHTRSLTVHEVLLGEEERGGGTLVFKILNE